MFVLLWRKKVKTSKEKFFQAAAIFLYLFAIFLLLFIFSLEYFFEGLSFEQICFHVQYAKDIITLRGEYIVIYSLFVVTFFAGALFLFWLMKKISAYTFFWGSLLLFFTAFFWGSFKYDFFSYLRAQFEYSNFYEKNYVHPRLEEFSADVSSKNIIILFLESIESGYGEKTFSDNLLKNISSLNKSMGNYYQIYGSNWTTAGLVAALCSVPLDVDVSYNQYDSRYEFLPNLVCLPDILNHLGYDNYFIYGGSSQFGGIDAFLKEHGFSQRKIYDFNSFNERQKGKIFGNAWGYPDSLLFDFLKKKLLELQKGKNKFFILSETVDTHYPYEYLDKKCSVKYHDWRDVIICSDKQVGDFVHWFYQHEFDKNTILLIISDHLSMDEQVVETLSSRKLERKLISLLIANQNIKQRQFSSLDIMPTLIDAANISYKSSKLGLGSSLFDYNQKTLIEKYGLEELNKQLRKNSLVYESFL